MQPPLGLGCRGQWRCRAENAHHRRVLRQGVVWSRQYRRGDLQWEGRKFCRFVYSFIAYLLPTLIIAFTVQRSNSSSALSPPLLGLSQTNRDSCYLLLCLHLLDPTRIFSTDALSQCLSSVTSSSERQFELRFTSVHTISIPYYHTTLNAPPSTPLLYTLPHFLIMFTNWVLAL